MQRILRGVMQSVRVAQVVTNESVNTFRAILTKNRHLTLRELETIMNDSLGTHFQECRSLVL